MAKNQLDAAAYIASPPATLGRYLRAADGAIATITGRVPGAQNAALRAIFSHAEPIKDSIVREAPPGDCGAGRYAHVDGVLQAAFFLVLHALGPVHVSNTEWHFVSWWSELDGRAQLVELAAEHGRGVTVANALDVLRRAKWEWGSFSSRRIFAAQIAEELNKTDPLGTSEVAPQDLDDVVVALVSAAEVIVLACWPRE